MAQITSPYNLFPGSEVMMGLQVPYSHRFWPMYELLVEPGEFGVVLEVIHDPRLIRVSWRKKPAATVLCIHYQARSVNERKDYSAFKTLCDKIKFPAISRDIYESYYFIE